MKRYFIKPLISALYIFSFGLMANTYVIPKNGGRLIGENTVVVIPVKNKKSLEYYAAFYKQGLSNVLEANPGIDPYLPRDKEEIIMPSQLILPDAKQEGVIINVAEMRLYYYPKKTNTVIVLPIGIGQVGKETPTHWVTQVKYKKSNPRWVPTPRIRAEYAAEGIKLPAVFPSGEKNPMGLYALYIGKLYAIHGTNADFGIGLRVSHGCIRLRNEDIKFLFDSIPEGTRVEFINEPIKFTSEPNGKHYIEVHNPLSMSESELDSDKQVSLRLSYEVTEFLNYSNNNQNVIKNAIANRSGLPVLIN